MQMAAHEARLGHGKLATELRETIDQAKRRRGAASVVSISKPRGELANLLQVSQPKARLPELILDPTLSNQIARVIREQRKATDILEPEKPTRFERLCFRALAEDVVSESRAAELLGISVRELDARMDATAAI